MIILTLTTTSVSYASSSRDSKQTYFWVLICELAVRGYLSFFVLTALEFNVEDVIEEYQDCLLYTSDAADEEDSVDLGGRRLHKKIKRSDTVEKNEYRYDNTKNKRE
eukprot:TRINITY_DN1256_c0_g1_i2.p2 TRINITY_DN1256_c0_g1~~TRINITY_DN1256_c0_g1_i2.p2  ORF type:complete len:107 (-),score=19.06 TRINITY_DN1256_c0_g1_i2:30-350(-)